MDIDTPAPTSKPSAAKSIGLVAITALAYVLCDLLHELGHAAATMLPLGTKAVSISTIGLSSVGVISPVVAAAGPVVNLLLASALLLALAPRASPTWRYFAWLFGTVNLLNGTAYFVYSSILGTGDWATVFSAVGPTALWRPISGLGGAALYIASILASSVVLRRLCVSGVVAKSNINRYCNSAYWAGGVVITAGAVFNPVSAWFILTSGAAVGFGAMLGLLALPALLNRKRLPSISAKESLRITWPWVSAGAIALVIFLGIFGPGLHLPL
jgi:hypothetical protein